MLSCPILLTKDHQLDDFSCNVDSLNDWLKKWAYQNQLSGASRTYVVLEGKRVVGYYCLASGALELNDAPTQVRRNMPNPIPVAILGRLAVGSGRQGCESRRVKVPPPSVAQNGRLAYPLLGEVTDRDRRGRKSHGRPVY